MPKLNPTVSIIIPNYNHARYLPDAINSVLSQTYTNYEIIVVDDGSTDDSREVASKFGDKIQYIHQDNAGLSAARNTGIRASNGGFIGVLDADDMYEPDFIGTLVGMLESQPDADGIYCGYRFVDHLNHPLPQVEARDVPPEKLFWALADGNFLVPESMFVRRYCYDKAGLFDTSLRALEDLDMWLRITRQFRIIHTTRVLTRHRILPGSMSTDPTRQFKNRLNLVKKHFGDEPAPGGAWSGDQRRAYGRAYLTSAVEYLQAHNESRAYECVYAMVNAWPELLTRVETLYELGCGEQPKGYRGEFASVDMEQNYQTLMRFLLKLSYAPELNGFSQYRRAAYARTHYAFGLLAYGQDNTRAARRFFFTAVRYQPGLLFDRTVAGFILRSMIGAKLIHSLKQFRGERS